MNGVAQAAAARQSYDNDGAFTIGLRTDYTDATAGLASSTLTREQGTLAADACSAYGAPTTLVGTPAQSGLATGCYRYLLTGTDNVGNTVTITTVVKVDTSAPAAPGLVLSDSSADVHTTRHDRLLPARRQRLLRRHRLVDRRAVRDPRLQLPGPGRLHRLRHRRHPHLHPGDPDRAQRRQARHRPQPGSRQLQRHELHAHLGRCCPDRRRADRQHRRRIGRRHPELRRRRRLHHRPPHRLHRRGLRSRLLDAHARAGHAQRRRLLGLRRTHHPRRHARPERPRHRLLPLRPHRHRQRRQHRDDHDRRQGRHERPGGARPGSERLERGRAHHRHHGLLPPGRQRLLRRHRLVDRRAVRHPRLQLPGPGRLHRLRHRRHPHLHPGDADRAQRRQARHRPQPGSRQLERHELHAHLGRCCPDRWRADRQHRRRIGRRQPELRRRRRLHHRPPHRLHRRGLRSRLLDADARAGHAQRRRLLGLRRPHHPRRHARPERPRHRLLPLHPHRHRQRRQHRLDHHDRQGRHVRPDRPVTRARRLERRRPHDRHHGVLPPGGQRLLRRHRQLHRRPVRDRLLLLPHAHRLHPLGLGRRPHLHARDPDRGRRRQDGHGTEQRRPHQQLHVHAHRRLDSSERRLDHGERRRRLRQRRHSRTREDRPLRRRLRHRHADFHSRDGDPRQRRVWRIRRHRPGDDSLRQRRRHARRGLLPLHAHRHRQRRQPGRNAERDREGRPHGAHRPGPDALECDRRRALSGQRHDDLVPLRRGRRWQLRRHGKLDRRADRHRLLLVPHPRRGLVADRERRDADLHVRERRGDTGREQRHGDQRRRQRLRQRHLHRLERHDGPDRRVDHRERRRRVRRRRHRRTRSGQLHRRRRGCLRAHLDARERDARSRCVQQLLGQRPGDDHRRQRRRHARHGLLPLHAHRHRQRRQPVEHPEHGREGRHLGAERSDPRPVQSLCERTLRRGHALHPPVGRWNLPGHRYLDRPAHRRRVLRVRPAEHERRHELQRLADR